MKVQLENGKKKIFLNWKYDWKMQNESLFKNWKKNSIRKWKKNTFGNWKKSNYKSPITKLK